MSHIIIPRRSFLRGVGTLMALPTLEAMLPLSALAQSTSKHKATRMAFLFVPNGIDMANWTPATEGAYELTPTLAPLKNVKSSINVLTGLAQHNAFALGDGGGDHARSTAAWLTGCHPKKTDGSDIKNNISVDQIAAKFLGNRTALPSLEIGCEGSAQAGNCDSGYSCAYSSSIAWRGENTPVAHETNPRAVFERLFGNNDPDETAESRALRTRDRRSILDFVTEDANALKNKLGSRDKAKLSEYFDDVREIEQRLTRIEKSQAQAKMNPNYAPLEAHSYTEKLRLLSDMLVLAFQSDTTRIATFMFANDGSNRPYKDEAGVAEGHHDMSHHGHDPVKMEKVQRINKYHVKNLAYMLEKMQAIHEPDGTLLDNSMIIYGAGISDGDRHNHDDLPLLLAGKGGGTIRSNRHITYTPNTPMTNLFLTMLDKMGVPADRIGDSTGRLQQLF